MNRQNVRKLALTAALLTALGALGYFAFMRPQTWHAAGSASAAAVYYCPMHKDYHSDKPGNCPICGMKLVKLEHPVKPDSSVASAPSPEPVRMAPSGADQNQIFIAREKQQLIGMRSVEAESGVLTKEIRLVGKVTYDETKLTHIHSKVSGYIEEVFADSVGKPVRAGEPLFTIYMMRQVLRSYFPCPVVRNVVVSTVHLLWPGIELVFILLLMFWGLQAQGKRRQVQRMEAIQEKPRQMKRLQRILQTPKMNPRVSQGKRRQMRRLQRTLKTLMMNSLAAGS